MHGTVGSHRLTRGTTMKDGFYWVRMTSGSDCWEVARIVGGCVYLTGIARSVQEPHQIGQRIVERASTAPNCLVCGQPSEDNYLVTGAVWRDEARFSSKVGYCHLRCLEQRIGRPLVVGDFQDLPLNEGVRHLARRKVT